MERSSAPADAHRLIEQLYDCLDKPDLNRARDSMRELTDELSTLCMVRMEPEVSDIITSMMVRKLACQQAKLIELLLSRPGRAFSFAQCLEAINFSGHDSEELRSIPRNRLRVVVSQTRTKLQKGRIPYWIEAVWGLGYRIVPRDLSKIPANGIGNRHANAYPKRVWADLETLQA